MKHRLCPPWLGIFLASPIRKLMQNPLKILSPYVQPGMTAMDIGPGMGFFSLPMARLVGTAGRVVCVDLQPKMLEGLRRRARRAGIDKCIETVECRAGSLGLERFAGRIDFVLVFAVVHETPDAKLFFQEIATVLKPGGRLLLAEPKGHVSAKEFAVTVQHATSAGLRITATPGIQGSHTALMEKP
jgi:ubiquinone/menaquinone biosynthesis C-methylase UbiE